MEQEMSGIKALSRAILDDTRGEAEQIVADAQREAAAKKHQAQAEAEAIRRKVLDHVWEEITRLRQRSLATARLEAQRVQLKRREELIEAVFGQAAQELQRLRQSPQYVGRIRAILEELVVDAVEQLGRPAECFVCLAAQDMAELDERALAQLAARWDGRVRLQLGRPAEIWGGVILEIADGRQRYDNSFAARLAREQVRLRARVYQLVQGEE